MNIKIKTDEEMWKAALAVWKLLSKRPNELAETAPSRYKNKILNQLGYADCVNGCPFCELYFRTQKCPIGDCEGCGDIVPCENNTPFGLWSNIFCDDCGHERYVAEEFYEYLLNLKKRVDKNKEY